MKDDVPASLFDDAAAQAHRVATRTTEWPMTTSPPVLPARPYGEPGHVAGSDTSHGAAQSMTPHVGTMQARILALLDDRSATGITCDELEAITGWSHQSASARVRELVLAELIVDTKGRRPGRSGRTQRVYQKVC